MPNLNDLQIEFREYHPENDGELVPFLNEAFDNAFSNEQWKWKYHDNPMGAARSCIATGDGRIGAHFGGLPVEFRIDGDDHIAVQDVDVVVDANYRTFQGARRVNQCRQQINQKYNIDFIYGFAIESTAQISEIQYGYENIGPIPRMLKLLDYQAVLKSRRATRPFSFLGKIANVFSRSTGPLNVSEKLGFALESVEQFDSRFDDFWESIKDDYPIRVCRKAEYLNWRLLNNPYMKTTNLAVVDTKTGNIRGYASVGIKQEELRRGILLDLVTPRSETEAVAEVLLENAIAYFREENASVAVTWMFPHCHLYQALIKYGFRDRLGEQRLMFRNANIDKPVVSESLASNPNNWFITMADSDMF